MDYIRNNQIVAYVLSVVVLCMVVLSYSTPVHGYTTEGLPSADVFGDFVVGPGKMEIELEPGESQTIELTLANRMGDDRDFHIEVEDIKGSDDPGMTVVLLGNDRGPYSLRDYFQIPEQDFTLTHATRARIPVTISVPADAEPGGYYGTILFTTTSKKAETAEGGVGGGAAIVSRIGVLFFVTVPGSNQYEGVLQSFGTKNNQMFFSKGEVTFQTLFKNVGNMHLNPSGKIEISNILGNPIETINVEPWFALPQSLRLREVEWKRPNLIGRYTARLTLDRGYDKQTATETVSFWIVPIVPVGAGIAAIFFLFLVIRLIATRFEIRRK